MFRHTIARSIKRYEKIVAGPLRLELPEVGEGLQVCVCVCAYLCSLEVCCQKQDPPNDTPRKVGKPKCYWQTVLLTSGLL